MGKSMVSGFDFPNKTNPSSRRCHQSRVEPRQALAQLKVGHLTGAELELGKALRACLGAKRMAMAGRFSPWRYVTLSNGNRKERSLLKQVLCRYYVGTIPPFFQELFRKGTSSNHWTFRYLYSDDYGNYSDLPSEITNHLLVAEIIVKPHFECDASQFLHGWESHFPSKNGHGMTDIRNKFSFYRHTHYGNHNSWWSYILYLYIH